MKTDLERVIRGPSSKLLWATTAAFTAMAVFAMVVFFIRSSSQDADVSLKNGKLIEDLRAQIADNNSSLEKGRQADASKVECVTRFTYAIQSASSEVLVSLGDLVILIATTVPGPERDAAIGDGVDNVQDKVTIYRDTVQARIDYDVAGSPIPCPLSPGLTG